MEARKVLIVEDDPSYRAFLETILDGDGRVILTAANGLEAVEKFVRERPDVIVMDVRMPVMNGHEATRAIKKRAGDEFIPVIFLTESDDLDELARCIEVGGDDVLLKPASRVILEAKIRSMTRLRDLHSRVRSQRDELRSHGRKLMEAQFLARFLFDKLVPLGCLASPNLKYLLSPSSNFNGDFVLGADLPSGGQRLMVGDFTGHGLAAAVGTIPTAGLFHRMTSRGFSVEETAARINDHLNELLPPGMFCSACLLEWDAAQETLTIWNGGLPDVIIRRAEGSVEAIRSSHVPLGILSEEKFERSVEILEANRDDRIVVYSDGLIEARNPSGEFFGSERLLACIRNNADPEQLFDEIREAHQCFSERRQASDDLTLLELRCAESAAVPCQEQRGSRARTSPATWELSLDLGAAGLRELDAPPLLLELVDAFENIGRQRGTLFTVLSELNANAFEHGVLGLESALKDSPDGFVEYFDHRERRRRQLEEGRVRIDLRHEPRAEGGKLTIRVEDSGSGFDHTQRERSLDDDLGNCGRGIGLLRALCSAIRYEGNGNVVKAVFPWGEEARS
jgi:CheY-like chemotaxis protein